MARKKSKGSGRRKQAPRPSPKEITQLKGGALKAARRQLDQLQREREAARRAGLSQRERRAFDAERRRASDDEYRRRRSLLKEYGLYQPTSGTLTPYRKAAINKRYRELEELLKGGAFAEYPSSSKRQQRTIKRQARSVGAKITKKGIFLGRDQREMRAPRGKLKYDRSTGLWEMEVKKRFKTKDGHVTYVTENRPLAGFEALDKKKDQLRRRFAKLPPLKKNQRLRFQIQGRNISKLDFRDLDSLFKYAEGYRKTARARAAFIDSLTIVVLERDRAVGGFKARNFHEVDPDLLEGFEPEEEDDEE